ncbi:MAG: ATP-grasp domain-containing protein [Desulfonatronovibrionaceae bacterium]
MTDSLIYPKVAVGQQLSHCPSVVTLGVCTNLSHYPAWKRELLFLAPKVYFPTSLFAETISATGRRIFPSVECYRYAGDKIKQTILFQMQGLPVPRTRFYFGKKQKKNIISDFSYPFIAKTPRNSSMGKGVQLINNDRDLEQYLECSQPAYIQDYLPGCRDFRVIMAGNCIVHAYERVPGQGEFRANVALGGSIVLGKVPEKVLQLARRTAGLCSFSYTGLDICVYQDHCYLLEANMKFGLEGFHQAGLDLQKILRSLIARDVI